jgi:monofunctional glycosyltransferase
LRHFLVVAFQSTVRSSPSAGQPAKRGWFGRLLWFLGKLALWLLALSLVWVLAYRFIDPPVTSLMLRDWSQDKTVKQSWRDLDQINRNLVYAAIAAEDARFCSHWGFDFEAIEDAMEANERARERGRKRLRGASTISQQTAKNAFLWPDRSWVRKGAETYFTLAMEALWPKRRIMEVYLNIAEWGPGIYGAEAASQHYFGKSAARLTRAEAARLASILPSPLKWSPTQPSKRVARKARVVRKGINVVADDSGGCIYGKR